MNLLSIDLLLCLWFNWKIEGEMERVDQTKTVDKNRKAAHL